MHFAPNPRATRSGATEHTAATAGRRTARSHRRRSDRRGSRHRHPTCDPKTSCVNGERSGLPFDGCGARRGGARCRGDGDEDVLSQSGATGGLVRGVGLPAAPDDPGPRRGRGCVARGGGCGRVGGSWRSDQLPKGAAWALGALRTHDAVTPLRSALEHEPEAEPARQMRAALEAITEGTTTAASPPYPWDRRDG
jgi:hypothetical protein